MKKVTMEFLKGPVAILALMLTSGVALQAQQLDSTKTNWLTTETTSQWFVLKPQQPVQSQKTPAPYVFPTASKRFHRYVKSSIGPFALLKSSASAALNQWDDNPQEWGQGAEGYGKRLASNLGGNVIRQTVTYGLSEALRLDTGFEKSSRTGFWPRLSDALVQNVTSRTHSGKRVISAPILAGTYVGSINPTETWYPSRYGYKDGLREGTYSLATGFVLNAVREFIFNW